MSRRPVSSFQFPVSSFQFPVSNFKFPVSSFQFQVSSFKFQISNFKHHPSSALLTTIAISFVVSGFMTNSRMPSSLAFCSVMSSLNPVHRTIGISGRMPISSLESLSPVISGIVMSVITRSNRSGCSLNTRSASRLSVLVVTL